MSTATEPTATRDSSTLIKVSSDQLRAEVEQILAAYPKLRDFTPECGCGSIWCGNHQLSNDERHAYDQLDQARWLLGET